MSRIQVTATASATTLVLTDQNGGIALKATPDTVFDVGSSVGGYLAAPVDAAKPHVWGLWRVTGGQIDRLKGRDPSGKLPKGVALNGSEFFAPAVEPDQGLLESIKLMEPERVVVSGREYLFATTSASARNGVVHRYQVDTDPVVAALRPHGVSPRYALVESGEGEAFPVIDWEGVPTLRQHDGKEILVQHNEVPDGVWTRPGYGQYNTHLNVVGWTYLVLITIRRDRKVVDKVFVTKSADRATVAGVIEKVYATTS